MELIDDREIAEFLQTIEKQNNLMTWQRQRTHEELNLLVQRRLAALGDVNIDSAVTA